MSSVVFLPQISQSHRSPGFPEILCARIVTAIPKPSLSSCRTSTRVGKFPPLFRAILQSSSQNLCWVRILIWKLLATQLGFKRRGFLLFPSGIFLSPLTNLSTPGHPSRTGAPHVAVVVPSWRYACKHPVEPSSPSRRPIRLQRTVCSPSVA